MEINTHPIWTEFKRNRKFPLLPHNIGVDVAVIGGGLAGVTSAYKLAKEGKRVLLLEADRIGEGATEYTTAMITQEVDTDISDLVKIFGEEKARLVWQAGADAIDMIEQIVKDEKIECDFKRVPGFIYASTEDQTKGLQEDFETSQSLGFDGNFSSSGKLALKHFGIWEIPNQAKFHPLKFLFKLSEVISDLGVEIHEKTEATDIEATDDKIVVQTKSGKVIADYSIMATYQPFKNPIQTFMKKGMYRSYMMEFAIPKGTLPEAIYWDCSNPYYYFRIDPQEEYDSLIMGGADHRSEIKLDKEKGFKDLENYFKQILPDVNYEIKREWTGPILEPSDGLALIGEYHPRELIATAFSGNGMTYSMISAEILTDLVLGKHNAYAHIFDPKRLPEFKALFQKAKDYGEELIGGAGKLIFGEV